MAGKRFFLSIFFFKSKCATCAKACTPESVLPAPITTTLSFEKLNIAFCNTGHWAATAWFTLSEVLKLPNTKMYDGSMVEWTADTSRPLDNKL
jgi:thiosulfate/3-mercaptopyruvate sulfurtransferase